MSGIDYQALREAAVAIETVATPQKLQAFRMKVTPSVVLALLDEIKRLEDTNIDAMCRIAELEAREVELPDGYEPRMGHPINSGERVVMMPHHFGGWLDRVDGEHALQAAGIKFKTAGGEYE